jgi:arginine utilization protein RocB
MDPTTNLWLDLPNCFYMYMVMFLLQEIKRQNKKYEQAKEKLQKMRKQVEEEYNHLDTLQKRTHALEKLLSIEELNLKLAKQEVIDLRERHFKASEELFSLKAAGFHSRIIKFLQSFVHSFQNELLIFYYYYYYYKLTLLF